MSDGADDRRALLTQQRDATLRRLAGLQREFAALAGAAAVNSDDEHDPEGATIAFERQHLAALVSQAEGRLEAIDAALARLEAGTYGVCSRCGQPIPAARLAARPTATTCTACAGGRTRR